MKNYLYAIVFVALLAVAVLSGCRKHPGDYGNFARAESVELVQDAMSALEANYLPAKTRISLVQETPDTFGSSLVEIMRANGYAVAEYAGPARADKYLPVVEKPDGLPFAYVINTIGNDEIRVSLHVGSETLSRMYRVQRSDDAFQYIPQGFWTRKQ